MEKETVPFTITPRDPLGKILFPILITLSSAHLEVLVPEWGVLLLKVVTNIP